MKANPIGIIDSGVGGLTVVKEVIRQLPNESVIYLGDTARCPYGPRPAHEIKRFTWEMTRFLQQFRIKMLIIACNTATAVALDEIRAGLPIPVIGVIHPGSRAAIKISETKRIGVIGTEMTIKSKAYERALKSIHKSIFVTGLACPDFVPLVERGEWSGEEAERTVARSLAPLKSQNIDTLILGCTHYPLLEPVIDRFFEHRLHLISSGKETAREASFLLDYMDLLNDSGATPRHLFFTTGEAEKFKCLAEKWLDLGEVEVETIRL